MKLTKEQLKSIIDQQEELADKLDIVDSSLGITNEWFGWEVTYKMIDTILSCFSDEDSDWISYYMFECGYGKEQREIEFKDGRKELMTFDVLWELLSDDAKEEKDAK